MLRTLCNFALQVVIVLCVYALYMDEVKYRLVPLIW